MTESTDPGCDDVQEGVQDKTAQRPPPMYHVFLLNDDYTPMEFVVEILQFFFDMSIEQATEIMLKVHNQGKGLCGVYTHDVAQTKSLQVNEHARAHDHPLLCTVEPIHE